MGSRGLAFDGLDQNNIITNVVIQTTDKNEAAYFQATDSSNQFRSTTANLDLYANSQLSPTFNFVNTLGSTANSILNAGTLNVGTISTTGNISTSSTLNQIQTSHTSLDFKVNSETPTFNFKGSSGTVVNSKINAGSLSLLPFTFTNTPISVLSTFAENALTGGGVQYSLGKNLADDANTFYLKYIYDQSLSNRRFSIQPLGYSDTLSVYRPSITATSTEGSVIVNGGLSSGNIYSSGTLTSTGAISGASLTATGSGTISTAGSILGSTQTLSKPSPGRILYLNSTETTSTNSTTELFRVMHNSGGITGNLYALGEFFAQNMPTGTSAEIRVGKQYSAGFNNYSTILGYTYNTTTAQRKGYIRLSEKTNTIEFFQPSTVGTTANTGTVVVDGDIAGAGLRGTSLNLYETTSSANAVKLQATASTSAYTLKFPTNLGSSNDYLQLGASGQLQWSAGTGGGSGGSSAYVSAASYTGASTTYATGTLYKVVTFGTNVYDVNTSIVYNPSPGTYPYFSNNSGGTIYVQVNAIVSYNTSVEGTYRTAELRRTTGPTIDPIAGTYTTIMKSWDAPGANATAINSQCKISAIVKLLANECFIIVTRQGTSGNLSATADIQFSVLGGSGLQSITLNSTSSFLTGSAQTTGLNPTVNFGLAQTPSGTGTTLVTTTSPSITTPTITSPTFSGTYSTSPTSVTTPDLFLTSAIYSLNLKAPYLSSAYTLTLPATGGSSGQLLSSLGSGTLDWADVGTSIGTSGSSITSPMLTIDGTSTSSSIPNLLLRDYRSGSVIVPLNVNAPNLTTNQEVAIRIGKANSSYDSVRLGFNFQGTGSIQNYFFATHYNQDPSIKIYTSTTSSTSSTSGTLVVDGGIGVSHQSVFGSSTRSVNTDPILKIQGVSSSTLDKAPLLVQNYSTTSAATITALTPSLTDGNESVIRFGRDLSTFNSAALRFYYAGNASNSNYASINLFSQGDSIRIYDDGVAATNTTTGTVVVQGGVGCSSISTNTLRIGEDDYTPTSGTITDLELRWGIAQAGSDAEVTLSYPSIPYEQGGSSGAIPNRRVYWQKIGKSYTFSLNLYVSISSTSKQLHLLFIRSESNHSDYNFPTPACGSYWMGFTNNSHISSVKFGLGVYIPAM